MKARGILLVLLIVCLWFFFDKRRDIHRYTVAISSDPIVIWSWDVNRQKGVVIRIPGTVSIDASYGFGRYPVASLWQLGEMHQKNTNLLADSLSDNLAIPIPLYIGLPYAQNPFSLRHLFSLLGGSYRTNISPLVFIKLMQISFRMKENNTEIIDVARENVLQKTMLPDSSEVFEINFSVLDTLLSTSFEDLNVRKEAIPLGVYNTTKIPTVGTRMSRMVSHLGGNVVLVGNSTEDVPEKCQLVGTATLLKSYSARFLAKELGCSIVKNTQIEIGDRVELAIFVGLEYAKRFSQY